MYPDRLPAPRHYGDAARAATTRRRYSQAGTARRRALHRESLPFLSLLYTWVTRPSSIRLPASSEATIMLGVAGVRRRKSSPIAALTAQIAAAAPAQIAGSPMPFAPMGVWLSGIPTAPHCISCRGISRIVGGLL